MGRKMTSYSNKLWLFRDLSILRYESYANHTEKTLEHAISIKLCDELLLLRLHALTTDGRAAVWSAGTLPERSRVN